MVEICPDLGTVAMVLLVKHINNVTNAQLQAATWMLVASSALPFELHGLSRGKCKNDPKPASARRATTHTYKTCPCTNTLKKKQGVPKIASKLEQK